VAARRVHEQGIDRVRSLLHRNVGRWMQRVDELDYRSRERMRGEIQVRREDLTNLQSRLHRMDLRLRFSGFRNRLDAAANCVAQAMKLRLNRAHRMLEPLTAHLVQLSPTKILDRGYAIVRNADGHVVKDSAEVGAGADLEVLLAKGRLGVRVSEK
jgi:exodeoxyribonuclease VII large subunit